MGGVGGMQMRLNGSRFRRSSALAVVGGCLAVYIVLAVGFHWFVEPTLGKNQAVSAYDPSPARIVPLSGPPAVAPARSEPASRLVSKPAASTKVRSAGPAAPRAGGAGPATRGGPPPSITFIANTSPHGACPPPPAWQPPPHRPPARGPAAAPRPPAEADRRHEIGAGAHGDCPLRIAVAGRI